MIRVLFSISVRFHGLRITPSTDGSCNAEAKIFIRRAIHNVKIEKIIIVAGGGEETLTAVCTMATSKWPEQDHTWYYLDASGAAVTGWKEIDGKWYYFKEDHAMATEETIGSYYVGKDGAWDSRK